MSNERYFNFPIHLLNGFLIDSQKVLLNIMDYCVYEGTFDLELGTYEEKIKSSANFYNINLGSVSRTKKNGKELFDNSPDNPPKVGMNISIWWDFYKTNKSDFEKICLLGFLAIKSILQQKAYCKITIKFMLARMNGKARTAEYNELPEPLKKYSQRYHYTKLKFELQNNWNLIEYSYHTRGFYVSFNLTLDQLIFEVEKRRKSRQEKELREAKKQARMDAIMKLERRAS